MKSISFSVFLTLSITLLSFISCGKSGEELTKAFSCDKPLTLDNLETVDDFNNHFSIQVPKHWNTKLYYDNKQSEIFSADTLKTLSESYIMDYSVVYGKLNIDTNLKKKVEQKIEDVGMQNVEEHFHKFKGFDAYAHLSRGRSKGMDLFVFQYYFTLDNERYMLIKSEFYGEENFENRFCEALQLIKKTKIK